MGVEKPPTSRSTREKAEILPILRAPKQPRNVQFAKLRAQLFIK